MLNDKQIQAAIKAVTTEITLNDGAGGRGTGSLMLVIRRLADGGISAQWFARWKAGGKRQKKNLGRYPEMSLQVARQTFTTEISPLIRAGKNPRTAVASATGKATVGRMFQAYVDSMKAKGRESAAEVERMLLQAEYNAADALGRERLAADVDGDDVVAYVSWFYRRGKRGAADKARAYVSAAFNWAKKAPRDYTVKERQDWGIRHNPAADVPKDTGATTTRERNLAAAELKALWEAATPDGEGFTLETASCVRLLICCGQRVQETLRLEGREIDLAAALWVMPKHKTKMKMRPHTIPLPSQAIPVLQALKAAHGDGTLFPARTGSKGELIDHRSIKQAIDRWLARDDVDLAPFQTRDLRRTWKSRTGEIGISKEMRDMIQQHDKGDTGSVHYDRADYLPQMREAMAKWDAWLDANVVPKVDTKLAA